MPEESGHALILARYPPRHGSWYLAKARGSLIIYDNPLIDPHCVVYAIPIGSLGPSDTKPYPECLRGNALKSCPNKDALREGDNVLARVRYPYGYESKAKQLGYEMGCVVQRTSDDGVLIEFEHGVREVVKCSRVCHMYLGGPTRLDWSARAMYLKSSTSGKPDFSISAESEISASPFISSLTSRNTSTIHTTTRLEDQQMMQQKLEAGITAFHLAGPAYLEDIEAHITAVRHDLANSDYIKYSPVDRKVDLYKYSGSFKALPEVTKRSREGDEFKRLWIQLVKHHHHNLPVGAKQRFSEKVNKDWYDL